MKIKPFLIWRARCRKKSQGHGHYLMYINLNLINSILSSMQWVIQPYADSGNISDRPHIESLAKTYNSLLATLDSVGGYDHSFTYFEL